MLGKNSTRHSNDNAKQSPTQLLSCMLWVQFSVWCNTPPPPPRKPQQKCLHGCGMPWNPAPTLNTAPPNSRPTPAVGPLY